MARNRGGGGEQEGRRVAGEGEGSRGAGGRPGPGRVLPGPRPHRLQRLHAHALTAASPGPWHEGASGPQPRGWLCGPGVGGTAHKLLKQASAQPGSRCPCTWPLSTPLPAAGAGWLTGGQQAEAPRGGGRRKPGHSGASLSSPPPTRVSRCWATSRSRDPAAVCPQRLWGRHVQACPRFAPGWSVMQRRRPAGHRAGADGAGRRASGTGPALRPPPRGRGRGRGGGCGPHTDRPVPEARGKG